MGGHAGGEVASQVAVATLGEALRARPPAEHRRIVDAVRQANRDIVRQALDSVDLRGMGTTLTGVALVGRGRRHQGGHRQRRRLAHLPAAGRPPRAAHRRPHLRGGAGDLGEISPAEARVHPQRNIVTRALGIDDDVEVDVRGRPPVTRRPLPALQRRPVQRGRRRRRSSAVLAVDRRSAEAADELVRLANEAGGRDNITRDRRRRRRTTTPAVTVARTTDAASRARATEVGGWLARRPADRSTRQRRAGAGPPARRPEPTDADRRSAAETPRRPAARHASPSWSPCWPCSASPSAAISSTAAAATTSASTATRWPCTRVSRAACSGSTPRSTARTPLDRDRAHRRPARAASSDNPTFTSRRPPTTTWPTWRPTPLGDPARPPPRRAPRPRRPRRRPAPPPTTVATDGFHLTWATRAATPSWASCSSPPSSRSAAYVLASRAHGRPAAQRGPLPGRRPGPAAGRPPRHPPPGPRRRRGAAADRRAAQRRSATCSSPASDENLAGCRPPGRSIGIAAFVVTLLVVRRVSDLARYKWTFALDRHRPAAAAVRARHRAARQRLAHLGADRADQLPARRVRQDLRWPCSSPPTSSRSASCWPWPRGGSGRCGCPSHAPRAGAGGLGASRW